MSDPVTNVEIEDVLSSIRRLVSTDERDQPQRGEEPRSASEPREARLVLTPAQRVDELDEDETSAEWDIETPETAEADDGRFDGIEDAEIVEARSEDADSDEEVLKDLPQFIHRGLDDRAEDPEEGKHAAEASLDEADLDEAADDDAEDEARYDASDGDWDEPEEDAALINEIAAEEDVADEEHQGAEDAGDMAPADGEDDTGEIDLKALEARIAGFETAVAEQDEEWEPDGNSDDDYAAGPQSPLPWQDADEDEVVDDQQADAYDPDLEPAFDTDIAEDAYEDAASASAGTDHLKRETEDKAAGGRHAEAEGGAWYSDDAILDEDALRDMVSEIVRQELQGALGERITRNVRKLVRREIHRALMSQGID